MALLISIHYVKHTQRVPNHTSFVSCVRNKLFLYEVLFQNLSLFTHQLELYSVRLDMYLCYVLVL